MFALIYLLLQAFPSVKVGDSGELIAAANILGNAHPPGYPLFSLLNKVFLVLLPCFNPAFILNSAQSFFAAFAAVLIFLIIKSVFPEKEYPAFFASLFAVSTVFFIEQATVTEVFMLNLTLALAVLYSFYKGKYQAGSFIFGLGLGNQHTLVLILPAALLIIFMNKKNTGAIFKSVLWFLAGFSVYLYLPVRASANPPINWSNPANFENFIKVLLRRDYGTFSLHSGSSSLSAEKFFGILIYFFQRLGSSLTVPGMAAFLTGSVLMAKRKPFIGIPLIAVFLFSGPLFFIIANMDLNSAGSSVMERFFLLPAAAAAALSSGIFFIKLPLNKLYMALPVFLLFANFTPSSEKPTPLFNYLQDVEKTLNNNEPLYISKGGVGDDLVFGLAYMKWAEFKMKDLKVFSEYASIFEAPKPIEGKAAFAAFTNEYREKKLFQSGLLFKNYSHEINFNSYKGPGDVNKMDYRQKNIAVLYPFFKGMYLITAGRRQEGFKELQQAETTGSDIPWLLNNLGNIYRDVSMFDKAYQMYKRAVSIEPGLAEAHNNIGNIFFAKKLYAEAAESYKKAISIKPDSVRYYNLGLACMKINQYENAAEAFRKSLLLDPERASCYNELGLIYLRTGREKEALSEFRKGLKIKPDDVSLVFNTALALEKLDSAEAERYWLKFLKLAPANDPDRSKALWYLKKH